MVKLSHIFVSISSSKPLILNSLMATSVSKPGRVRRLGELLQEQQEPFQLQDYLSERGYLKKISNSEARDGFCTSISHKNSKSSGSYGLRTRPPHCPKVLKLLINKLVFVGSNRKTSNWDTRAYEDEGVCVCEMGGARAQQVADLDQFSSASSVTLFDSCCESDAEDSSSPQRREHIPSSSVDTFRSLELCNLKQQEDDTDRKLQCGCMEDTKQLSPVSVLEEQPYHEVWCCPATRSKETRSTSSFNVPKEVAEDSIFSASMWDLLVHSLEEKQGSIGYAELHELLGPGSCSQYLKTRWVLQQKRQLLFDCVREALETHGTKRWSRFDREFLGPEDLGRIICEQICSWGKQCGDKTNITQLIYSDFSYSTEEWNHLKPRMRSEIAVEIGDVILEEMRSEIVTDMIDFFLQ
ncbi:PREDICTED: uncharacterized protein LOC104591240 isoform X2 [Nelumbo nucifera]|uniref:Uncharacterized protein LOC104591240 isoform X2 n=1 Tax=Nelumbo nucifera TaxID=4432 RepID=A0A1U7ZJ63_NELNU|nr:PREDICTED: uncharacterized protein LOC104591240 isoform X2 [Nelumbo nucifera]